MVDSPAPPPLQPVVVGVSPGQPPHIVQHAARFAAAFRAELICAYVNPGRFTTSESDDGSVTSRSIDPDFSEPGEDEFDAGLEAELADILAGTHVTWSTRLLAGDITVALGHLATTVDAAMIVVGTHERSFSGGVQEFFNRSVAVHLAHRQQRPVVVIPARPPGVTSPLPWVEAP
ncbi:Universal stress protein family protein [Sanguibacter gelidistatuariae]|uniref:Universal stress protein family protein n=1 Tax=Sanguibacter gelidistatuariae TaxID=1814289 RepID=A0A1G6J8C1_9MICO|nr:universal stress protein [Sanguibacter gelidistatuariae]SDC14879.1 Universal stress protein family protein [Sanguibacter gelidistatuariae]